MLSRPPIICVANTQAHTCQLNEFNATLLYCTYIQQYYSVSLLTHSSSCGRVETALTEGAEQRGLADARVANQDHLKQPVWGKQCSFFPLQKTIKHSQG